MIDSAGRTDEAFGLAAAIDDGDPGGARSSTARSPSPGATSTARVAPRCTTTSNPGRLRVQRGRANAVIEREPGDVDRVDPMRAHSASSPVPSNPE